MAFRLKKSDIGSYFNLKFTKKEINFYNKNLVSNIYLYKKLKSLLKKNARLLKIYELILLFYLYSMVIYGFFWIFSWSFYGFFFSN